MRRAWVRGLSRVLFGVFLSLLLAGSARAEGSQSESEAAPPPAEVVPPRAVESGLVIVTAESAEVRTGPSPKAEVIAVVEKGEVFEKLGRTQRWYLVKIDDEITGYISGRYIRRYQEGGQQYTYPPGVPYDGRYYPYYEYPYYWGQPYFSGDWYFYNRGWYGDPWLGHGRVYPPPPPGPGWPRPGVGPGVGAPPPPPPGAFRPGPAPPPGGAPGYAPPPRGGVPGGGMGPGPGPSGGMGAPPAPRR